MTEPTALTEFERHLTEELERYAAPAQDPRPTAQIATTAMETERQRSWSAPWSRRVVLGLAALLLVSLALVVAGAAALLRTAPTVAYRAVVSRQVDGALDVVLVDAEGHERVVRRLTPGDLGLPEDPGLEPFIAIEGAGRVSQQGWLEIWAYGPTSQSVVVLVDLADPARAPIVVPGDGFLGGRWGPDGRYALFDWDSATVLDPELGPSSETIVHGVQHFGGGPEIIWTADGSGFLARRPGWGVTPVDGGPFMPGFPKVDSRWFGTGRWLDGFGFGAEMFTQVDDPNGTKQVWYRDELAPATPIGTRFSADGTALWLLLDDSSGSSPQALFARMSGPGVIESIQAIDFPGPVDVGFTLSPDDALVAIYVRDSSPLRLVLAPVLPDGRQTVAGPVIEGSLAGFVPADAADT